ncbi:MAG: hypothetical protein JGK17_23445 [Microcoleus sp. PH2017_10_PVI_O_A]|nr:MULTISPECIES: hypothetical protein [unclassified Microcoleus]MCC3408485.1 hypothetical protein [Microcoleus sp. PH2017_10_PVI_O_A]MCC3462588.1 hypothetical protein [Microcoleus sp. PH2017_11_PCY_U_A]MCC3481010.1 hypothetical protein [Microcoleus sp. PH2017_12_PCY_D_A]MCC3531038.1 hypothetical protein [Microcoleus sp. PH2017_21_RUC_O_A]MCC3543386.1 hypothetical protein [Microcoleus sp. PH2017_22_RUC_O_B]
MPVPQEFMEISIVQQAGNPAPKVRSPACQFGCRRGTMEYREKGQAR